MESAVIATAPVANAVRFSKKRYATPSHDVLIFARDWKTLPHCASCTGGGMWSVRW